MSLYHVIYNFFSRGNAPFFMLGVFGAVTYVFAVTFFACLFSADIRLKSKRFFVWFIFFGSVACAGCSVLDILSARVFTYFGSALYPLLFVLSATVEYGILALQSKIGVLKKAEQKVKGEGPSASTVCPLNVQTLEKREKKASICEDPFRKTEVSRMETPRGEEPFGENYLSHCITYLKAQPLNVSDRLRLAEISKRITFPIVADTREKRSALCSDCGEIITMLAKYK